jgi:hypothetical protein
MPQHLSAEAANRRSSAVWLLATWASSAMNTTQTITYGNGTATRLLIILEPWAEQYWIEPADRVDIKAHSSVPGQLEFEHTQAGLIIYGWEGSVVWVLRDGKELEPSPQAS